MPTNPFKRRGQSGGSVKSKSGSSGGGSSSRQGITIAAERASNDLQKKAFTTRSSGLLLPESDYRQSLIMPHLTKRFTLLRAPDGTMVTPDAMRAHLRAQRARARAAGVPGTQCFLTEEEEDEIIDQLKRQTRMEEMDEWEQKQQQLQQAPQQSVPVVQFGGTDGFGSWTSPRSSEQPQPVDSKIDASLADTLSNLHSSTSTTSVSQEGTASGGFFTSRSSARDLAYMKEVEKARTKKGADQMTAEQEQDGLQRVQEEEGHDESKLDEEDTHTEQTQQRQEDDGMGAEAHGYDAADVTMPGDFLVAEHRQSRRLSSSEQGDARRLTQDASPVDRTMNLEVPTSAKQPRQSQLLTTLSPEAFNRVSTALEEVYGMVAGRVEDDVADTRQSTDSGAEQDEREERLADSRAADRLSRSSRSSSGDDVRLPYDYSSSTIQAPSDSRDVLHRAQREELNAADEDEASEERESLDDGVRAVRTSMDSATNSFTSARSEVAAPTLDGQAHMNGAALPQAPAGWRVSPAHTPQGSSSSRGASVDEVPVRRAGAGQPLRHAKGSMGSIGSASAASYNSNSPASRKANLVSLDPANGKMKLGPATPDSTTFATMTTTTSPPPPPPLLQSSLLSGIDATPTAGASPLSMGFHLAGGHNKAAAAAAATAAGVAAASYVSQAQEHRRTLLLQQQADAQQMPWEAAATPNSEVTLGVRQGGETLTADTVDGRQRRPSAAANQVLSANAIAARSQKYFPNASKGSMQNYADGFRPTVRSPPSTSNGHHQGQASNEQSPAIGQGEQPSVTSSFTPHTMTPSSSTATANYRAEEDNAAASNGIGGTPVHSSLTVRDVLGGEDAGDMTTRSDFVPPSPQRTGTSTTFGLSPLPPTDPEEAAKWRERYGMSADEVSVRSGISAQISEDDQMPYDEQKDEEEDVWARVARNTSPKTDARSAGQQATSASEDSAKAHDSMQSAVMSMTKLQQIQSHLVRSASARKMPVGAAAARDAPPGFGPSANAGRPSQAQPTMDRSMLPPSSPPPASALPQVPTMGSTFHTPKSSAEGTTSGSAESSVRNELMEKARERARALADRKESVPSSKAPLPSPISTAPGNDAQQPRMIAVQDDQSSSQESTDARKVSAGPSPSADTSGALVRNDSSARSFRTQVMYDVTSSHRPTSPPPRTHKKSLSNLPTLQDLTKSSTGWQPSTTDRNSTSLISMIEHTTRMHDQLASSDPAQTSAAAAAAAAGGSSSPIREEPGAEFEEVQVEDGFGGFTWERRRIPRSQSHGILSSMVQRDATDSIAEETDALHEQPRVPQSPQSIRSEPTVDRSADGAGWSHLPNEEQALQQQHVAPQPLGQHQPAQSSNIVDDVAAQARAATYALKGDTPERPRLRTKSLGRGGRKKLTQHVSQPFLLSTTQRLEHTQDIFADATLRRKGSAAAMPPPSSFRAPQPSAQVSSAPPVPRLPAARAETPSRASKPMSRSGSVNTMNSKASSPTDYKKEAASLTRKASEGSSATPRRSNSFGQAAAARTDGRIGLPSPSQSPSVASDMRYAPGSSKQSPGTPQSDRAQQTGLGRLMSRFRSINRKGGELPAVIEPFPHSPGDATTGRQLSATRSSPALSGGQQQSATTPNSLSSPRFQTPKESPSQFTPSPAVNGRPSGAPTRVPATGYTPLSNLFASPPSASGLSSTMLPPRTSSFSAASTNEKAGAVEAGPSASAMSNGASSSSLGPAAPIHARAGRQIDAPSTLGQPQSGDESSSAAAANAARNTVIRRTIIVSTYEPAEERRRSLSNAARKNSLRKPVDRQSSTVRKQEQQKQEQQTFTHHRRHSSTASTGSKRRSLHDRPPTPPGPEGVSGQHRRKLSQEVTGQPMPATARHVYEAPTRSSSSSGGDAAAAMAPSFSQPGGALGVPSRSSFNAARGSTVSGYGGSLYDMYIYDDSTTRDDDNSHTGDDSRSAAAARSTALAPPMLKSSSSAAPAAARQSMADGGGGGGGARHIEVTERADGSVVWQVIAGLADHRSSTYSASVGYGHSRQASDTSQFSYLRHSSGNAAQLYNNAVGGGSGAAAAFNPGATGRALGDEDGRSLFARTRGKKSFSIDSRADPMPALPSNMAAQDGNMGSSSDSAGWRGSSDSRPHSFGGQQQQQQQQPLDFEMATPAGQAATRIVYTSDAELAGLLESLAGPDKASAKFAFQRMPRADEAAEQPGRSSTSNDAATSSRGGAQPDALLGAPGGAPSSSSLYSGGGGGRPASIWTESEVASDPTGALRSQRFKIEAEIYSLLQREPASATSSPSMATTNAKAAR